MEITLDWLEKQSTSPTYGVGWTNEQAQVLRLPWPLVKGWKRHMVGKTISDGQAREFERLGMERRRKLAKAEMALDGTW